MLKKKVKIVIGADHGGFQTKEAVKKLLLKKRIPFEDVGVFSEQPVDYPDIARKVAKKVAAGKNLLGILVCGTGIGMCIAANKVKGIRAALVYDSFTARMSKEHNNANILCLRGRRFSRLKAVNLAGIWLSAGFSKGSRHKRRISKIKKLE